jgi:hypothetical protein
MKVKTFAVTFTREFTVTVLAPETATLEAVQKAASDEADGGLRDWFPPDWEAFVSTEETKEVPITAFVNKNGFRQIRIPIEDPQVLDGDAIVCPEDAKWLQGLPIDRE